MVIGIVAANPAAAPRNALFGIPSPYPFALALSKSAPWNTSCIVHPMEDSQK
jgi:hypothetical protein